MFKKRLLKLLLFGLMALVTAPTVMAADLVQKNAFAYDIRVDASNPVQPKVSYKLNGLASKVVIQTLIAGEIVSETEGTVTQTNNVTMPSLAGKPAGKVTYKLVVTTKSTVASPSIIKDENTAMSGVTNVTYGYRFSCPMGVAVNNCVDSPSFGQILVTEGANTVDASGTPSLSGSLTSNTYHSSQNGKGRGSAIYAFDPQMQPILNGSKYGFTAGYGVTNFAFASRLKFSDDGRLFAHNLGADAGVHELTTPSVDASHAAQLSNAPTKVLALSTINAGQMNGGLDVWGTGSNLKIGITTVSALAAGSHSKVGFSLYNLGTKKTWSGNPTVSVAATAEPIKHIIRQQYLNVGWDKDGKGITILGLASTPGAADASSVPCNATTLHYNLTGASPVCNYGEPKASGTLGFADVYSAAYNKDRTLLAVSSKTKITVYAVSVSNGGTPTFTSKYTITASGNAMTGLAFDYANNLYASNRSTEWFACWQLPASIALENGTYTTVPAPASQAFSHVVAATDLAAEVEYHDNGSAVLLTWNPGSATLNDASQTVMYSSDGGVTWAEVDGLDAGDNSYTLLNLNKGEYIFKIRTVAAEGHYVDSQTTNLTVGEEKMSLSYQDQVWDGGKQLVTLSWPKMTGIESYRVYCNGPLIKETANNEETVEMPMFDPGKSAADMKALYEVHAVINGDDATEAKYIATATVPYWLDFEDEYLQANACRTEMGSEHFVTVSWVLPKQMELVKNYAVFRAPATVTDGVVSQAGDFVQVGTVVKGNNTYKDADLADAQAYIYHVVANMSVALKLQDGSLRSTIEQNGNTNVDLTKTYNSVTLNVVKGYEGRTVVELEWSGSNFTYYMIYRNGMLIGKTTAASYIDSDVPVNNKETDRHTYYIVGVKTGDNTNNGSVVYACRSNEKQADIRVTRDPAVTRYGLEEIYNYTIVGDNDVLTDAKDYVKPIGIMANFKDAVGTSGSAGDVYRQGVFKDGKWMLAQLTNKRAQFDPEKNKAYIGITLSSEDKDGGLYNGGIVAIEARNMQPGELTGDRIYTGWSMYNQAIATDNAKDDTYHFFTRETNGTNYTTYYNSLALLGYLKGSRTQEVQLSKKLQYDFMPIINGASQINRVHYLCAEGRAASELGARVFAALNLTGKVYVMNVKSNAVDGYRLYEAPATDTKGNTITYGTENYAYPIAGRKDFMHFIRSNGVYYVNTENGEYTRIYSGSGATTSGGLTFAFNNQLFSINPTAIRSNNAGHFRIDLTNSIADLDANNNPKYDEVTGKQLFKSVDPAHPEKDFLDMIPVCAFTQNEFALWTAGNCNGNWFGVEEAPEENCIYIYQYVPGVRFAKYRFICYNEFPAVEPELDININYECPDGNVLKNDNKNTEKITHFDATFEWSRPEKYDYVVRSDYHIEHYKAELFDANMNLLTSWLQPDSLYNKEAADNAIQNGGTYEYPIYRFIYDGTSLAQIIDGHEYEVPSSRYIKGLPGRLNVNSQKYMLRVTPYYVNDNGNEIVGEPGEVDGQNSYPCKITHEGAKAFVDKSNKKFYRVDLDFDLVDTEFINDGKDFKYEEPADFYTLEWSKDGGRTFEAIPALNIHYNGGTWNGGSDEAIDFNAHRMEGDYRFNRARHNDKGAQSMSMISSNEEMYNMYGKRDPELTLDKMYSNKVLDEKEGVIDQAFPCVAYHTFEADHELADEEWSNYVYRFTGHYASDNPYIYQTTSVTVSPQGTPVVTGINDVTVDGGVAEGNVKAYPVPARTVLTVSGGVNIESIELFNTNGALVKTVKGNGSNSQTISVADLAAGNYVLRVNKTHTLHVIKH